METIMHLYELLNSDNFSVKEKFNQEIHGECPICGGTKRLVVKFVGNGGQCPELGSFFCRECDFSGNAITYLMLVRKMTFPAACDYIGFDLPDSSSPQSNRRKSGFRVFKKKISQAKSFFWYPNDTKLPAFVSDPDLWHEHALKFVDSCHDAIITRESAIRWFAEHGITLDLIKKYKLGFHAGQEIKKKNLKYQPSYRMAASWGIPAVENNNGRKQDKIYLPAGIVMPCICAGEVQRIQIRKFDHSKHIVKGSIGFTGAHWIVNPGNNIALICENERDGLVIGKQVPNITIIPLGSISGRPCVSDHNELRDKKLILLAFDPDKTKEADRLKWIKDNKISCPIWALGAGIMAVDWWYDQYKQANPWVIPEPYSDLGDAVEAGFNMVKWVNDGVSYYLKSEKKEQKKLNPSSYEFEDGFNIIVFLLNKYGSAIEKKDKGRSLGLIECPHNQDRKEMYRILHSNDFLPYLMILPDGVWTSGRLKKFFS